MAWSSRRLRVASLLPLLLLTLPLLAHGQLTSVPDLSSTGTNTETNTGTNTGTNTETNTGTNTGTNTQTQAQQTSDGQTIGHTRTGQATSLDGAPQITSTDSSASGNPLATATNNLGTAPAIHLTGLPTIAGAGIPTLVIPYTANAPFMQKSSLPEGTFFIAVGATLAFLGACVLLWRLLVAWSINLSVRRTAMLSHTGGSDKASRNTSSYWGAGGGGSYNRMASSGGPNNKSSYYKDPAYESTVSLDNLTSAGKPLKPHFRDSVAERNSTGPGGLPANLFFSPTAQAASQQQQPSHRSSGYMPSGYYASPSAQAGGGNSSIAIGGNLAPGSYGNTANNRFSTASGPSPPSSPGLPPQSRGSNRYSRDSSAFLRGTSRDGLRAQSRDGANTTRTSPLYAQPSSSSLMVGHQSSSDLPGSRAPSAYLEELFDNHGTGPRERF